MVIYQEKQISWLTILLVALTIGLMTVAFFHEENDSITLPWYIFLLVIFVLTILQTFQMKTTVDSDRISIIYGIGWIRKNISLKDISEISLVRGKWREGAGIRYLIGGTLYSINFTNSVKLKFHHKLRFIRIGSKNPEQLQQAIQKARHFYQK